MTARADAAQATYDRILEAAIQLVLEQYIDDLTLKAVAKRAGVTVQTVIRRFGTRARLLELTFAAGNERALARRGEAPAGDITGAVGGLFDEYEELGDRVIRVLAQEERVPEFRVPLALGRSGHRTWVERTFRPLWARRTEPEDDQMLQALIVATDVYTWKLLRRDMALDRPAAEAIVRRLITGIVNGAKEGQ